jgi:6-phosphogluconolactonase
MRGRDIELVVVDSASQVAAIVATRLAQAAENGGNIVLTGGKTPKLAYEQAAREQTDWSSVELWWGDERCVPPHDDRSNYKLAKDALLDRIGRQPRAVHRIRGELGKDDAATAYEAELGDAQLGLLLLGIGPEGHVASLFPNAPTLAERRRVVPAEPGYEPFVDRVTLTVPTLRGATEVLFLVTGSEKAEAARRAFVDEPDEHTPASLVRAADGRTTAVLDRAAAASIMG